MDIHNGHLHAPYFIFIKSATPDSQEKEVLDDDALIKTLIVACQRPHKNPTNPKNQHDVFVTKTGDWIHIMDDWNYSLWNNPNITEWIKNLGEHREIFVCAAGEIDDTHEWAYYNHGQLQRSVEFRMNKSGKLEKEVDIGMPLEGEWKANLEEDVLDKILAIAASLGINLQQSEAEVWSYSFLQGKIVNTKEVFRRQDKTAAQRREEVKVKKSGKQLLAALFALTLLVIFGGYHFFSEEALANRLAEEEQAALMALMAGPEGERIKRDIYLAQVKQRVTVNKETELDFYLDSIYQNTLPENLFDLSDLKSLTVLPSDSIDINGNRKYMLQSIPTGIAKLTNLKNLVLTNHEIKDLPKELEILTQLEYINLRGNGIATKTIETAKDWMNEACNIEY